MLAYSRGALLALAIGLALWFAVVPLRLRAALALIGGVLVATRRVVAWAFAQDGLSTERRAPLALRIDAGQGFGRAAAAARGAPARGRARRSASSPTSARRARRTRAARGRVLLGGARARAPPVAILLLATPGGIDGPGLARRGSRLTEPGGHHARRTPRSG